MGSTFLIVLEGYSCAIENILWLCTRRLCSLVINLPYHKLCYDDGSPNTYPTKHNRLERKLIYLLVTRLNIAYVVGMFSQYVETPMEIHWELILRILHGLKGTTRKGLIEKIVHLKVESYIGAYYA